ncbi:2Fe-2S iron-sulfur cluster-binding protein [Phenylobacterium sp.]|uniref:2Fe-2S iron-sulfur cluster-binding protein n=1 Tax=Phenylobacterium sp. TaxID=1871053 RepID=UPI0035AFE681
MPKIIYHTFDGAVRTVDAPDGTSVMEAAVRNSVPGIDGDCGGACACATCHVYVPEAWLARLEPQSDMEQSMLEFAENVRPDSRLGCQIKMSASLDGLELFLPESQH